jgi:uncharacterized iron-regulated membrane protein
VFILIVLIWFYVLAIILLGGATVNAMHLDDILARRGLGQPAPAAAMAARAAEADEDTGASSTRGAPAPAPSTASPEPRGGSA